MPDRGTDYFNKALNDFAGEVAYKDAVRHLLHRDMSVSRIMQQLSYPVPKAKVIEMVWKYYLDEGIIRLAPPDDSPIVRVSYVRDHDSFGRTSFRRVEEAVRPEKKKEYVRCDFGKKLYKDREAFINSLNTLEKDDREYILDLPWPLEDVWHIKNERIARIMKELGTIC